MNRIEMPLAGVYVLEPAVYSDSRGFFLETWNERAFEQLGIVRHWVQDNYSHSQGGVLRGMHYQLRHPQAKLVRVLSGRVCDVAVDVRYGSPTFGKWVSCELSSQNKRAMFIPEGFAHGFYVMDGPVDFAYKCSDFYDPQDERGVLWSDPALAIDWPAMAASPLLSVRDAAYPTLASHAPQDLPQYNNGAEA